MEGAMAYNNVGDYWLGAGHEVTVSIAYDAPIGREPEWGGTDRGAQWIMAAPIGIDPARLVVRDHTKEHKPRRTSPGDPIVVYSVTVINAGSESAHFNLQGGGNA
jgi:hypothetical protein